MPVNIYKLSGEVDVNTGKAEANLKRHDQVVRKNQTSLNQLESTAKKTGQGIASSFSHSASSATGLLAKVNQLHSKLASLKAPSMNFGGGSGGGIGAIAGGNLLSGAITGALSAVGGALKDGWSAGIEYNKMLEKANISFTTLLGTTAKAQEHLKALQAFGEATPFEFPDLIKASQRMQAMGFEASKIIPTLKNVGDAVSAVGGGKEELDGVVLALGQMQTKGRVSAEEMNQLAERGIPAWDLLAKAIGKTKAETIKLSESGRLNGGRAVEGITAMMGERFGGQMDKMSGTLTGRESNFQDILNRQLGAATTGNFAQLRSAYEKATIGLGTTGAQAFAGELNKQLSEMGKLIEPALMGIASGDYFVSAAKLTATTGKAVTDTINAPSSIADKLKQGDYKGALIGDSLMPTLEKGGLADRGVQFLKDKFFSLDSGASGSFTSGVASGVDGAAKAGAEVGKSAETGVRDKLDMHSPSKVMESLGHDAIDGFVLGFENGKKRLANSSPIDIEKMRAAMIADLEKLRKDPRIKAMLDTIAKAEGTGAAYNMKFGGGRFSSLTDHPNDPVTRKMGGKSLTSTAAGRYQFLNRTWAGLDKQLGLPDFGEKSQDLGAIQLMKQRGMIDPIMKGDISGALTKGNREWASLPGSPYGQPTKKAEELVTAYNSALEKYNGLMGESTSVMGLFSSALDTVKTKLALITNSALDLAGYGTTPAAAIPRAVPQQRPGDGAAAKPFTGQTIQGGELSVMVKAKTELLALSSDAAAATVQMSIPLKELPTVTSAATEALKTTGSQAGLFADAIMETGKAAGEAIDHISHFKDALSNGFDDMFDSILNGDKMDFKSFGKSLFKGITSSLISSATGGKASTPGQMLSGMLTGGFGGGVPATGGFAGGGGAADILGGGSGSGGGGVGGALNMAQNVGGLFKQGGMLSKLPGLGKLGGFLGKIPGLGKLGSLFGFGGGGGAAAAGAGASGGAAGAGGMAAMFSNPATAALAIGSMVAMPLLSKLFAKDPLKDYRNHIKSIYGVDVKSKSILGKVMQAGQSKFGTEWQKRQVETVKLPEVRDMIHEYSQAFMLGGGNSSLFSAAEYGDRFSAVNQFKVKMLHGGTVPGPTRGYDHVPVLMDGGEKVISNADQKRGGWTGKAKAEMDEMRSTLAQLAEVIGRLKPVRPGAVLEMGFNEKPGLAAKDVANSYRVRDEHSQEITKLSSKR